MNIKDTKNLKEYIKAGGDPMDPMNQRILSDLVRREVIHCVSYTIMALSKLLESGGTCDELSYDDMLFLTYRDADPIDVCHDNGIKIVKGKYKSEKEAAEQALYDNRISLGDYHSEIFEHWAVTKQFGEELKSHGECVEEVLDFTVWGRCTTGQAIMLDHVVQEIAAEMQILYGQRYNWRA